MQQRAAIQGEDWVWTQLHTSYPSHARTPIIIAHHDQIHKLQSDLHLITSQINSLQEYESKNTNVSRIKELTSQVAQQRMGHSQEITKLSARHHLVKSVIHSRSILSGQQAEASATVDEMSKMSALQVSAAIRNDRLKSRHSAMRTELEMMSHYVRILEHDNHRMIVLADNNTGWMSNGEEDQQLLDEELQNVVESTARKILQDKMDSEIEEEDASVSDVEQGDLEEWASSLDPIDLDDAYRSSEQVRADSIVDDLLYNTRLLRDIAKLRVCGLGVPITQGMRHAEGSKYYSMLSKPQG